MKLIGWKRRLNGGKYGVGDGGPKWQLSAGFLSKDAFSHGTIFMHGWSWVHQGVAFVKQVMRP